MPIVWTPMMLEEEIFEEQRPLYVGKEAGQEAQRAIRAQATERAARVAAIRAAEPAPIFIEPRDEEKMMAARERMPDVFLPVQTVQPVTWDYLRKVSEILQDVDIPPPSTDPETQQELAEYLATPEAQRAIEILQRVSFATRKGLKKEELRSLPMRSKAQRAADKPIIEAFAQKMSEFRTGPTSEELIAAQRRSVAKIKPAQLEQPPKRLQAQVAKRMAPIDEYQRGWEADIARQRAQIYADRNRSRTSPSDFADQLKALSEKENDYLVETQRRRLAVQDWWKRQIAEDDKPVYFPEGEEERIIAAGGLTREVKFGKRAEIIERATGVAQDEPESVREIEKQLKDFFEAYYDAFGADLFDAADEDLGRAAREAAQLDIHAELAAITAQRNALKMPTDVANAKRAAVWAAHQLAQERYQRAVEFIRRAREVRRESQAAPIRDREIGEALRKIGPTRIASADRFTQELRGLYEYVDLPDPITGRLERTRVPKIDEKGEPIYLGILTKYAGAPGQTGSFMGQKMRVRQSATGAYERAERAELGAERAINRRKADKRTFARLVYQFNDYSQGEIDRGFTSVNIDAQRSAPRDEGLIKYYIREYGFVLPEWSKMPVPKRFRSTPTDAWKAEYGYGAPRKKTTAEGEADAARRRRDARSAAIAASRRKTSRPQ